MISGLISCTSSRIAVSHEQIRLSVEQSVSLPPFAKSINDCLVRDSLIFISTSDGFYCTNINTPEIWIRLGTTGFKSFDLFDFKFDDGRSAVIVMALPPNQNVILAYVLDLENDTLLPISAGEIPSGVDQAVNLIGFKSDSMRYLFVIGHRGLVEHWQLYDPGWGQVDGKVIKQFSSPMFNKFLVLMDGIMAGAYPDKGWWSLDLKDNKQLVWLSDKNKAFKGKNIQSIAMVRVGDRSLIFVLFKNAALTAYDPLSGKQVVIEMKVAGDLDKTKLMLSGERGRLNMLVLSEGKWILQTYSAD